jgi:hypothetical protein
MQLRKEIGSEDLNDCQEVCGSNYTWVKGAATACTGKSMERDRKLAGNLHLCSQHYHYHNL